MQTMSADPSKQVKLGYVSGLVSREKSMAFERILFRATRGNVFLKQVVLDDTVIDPVSGEKVSSCTSLCFFFLCFFNMLFCTISNSLFLSSWLITFRLRKMYLLFFILEKEQGTKY